MTLEIPLGIFAFTPLVALVYLVAAYVKKNGTPDFYSVVAGLLLFFGCGLLTLVIVCFALKLYYPVHETYSEIQERYLLCGASFGLGKIGGSVLIKLMSLLPQRKSGRSD